MPYLILYYCSVPDEALIKRNVAPFKTKTTHLISLFNQYNLETQRDLRYLTTIYIHKYIYCG